MLSVTWRTALAWRLGRHGLDPVRAASTVDVVGGLGAVAAQLDPASAELGIRARQLDSRPGDVGRALAAGRLVRTFAFRGATHLMTPGSAGIHLALRAAGRMWERPGWRDAYRLEPGDWPALRAAVREALADGPLTRAELGAAVAADARFAHLEPAFTDPSASFLKPLAWQGDVSLGPSRAGALTLQRLDTTPGWTGLPDVDDAGPRAVEEYVRAYGPASADTLHYWLGEGLGVRRSHLQRWVAGLGHRLATVEVDGEPRWVLPDDVEGLAGSAPTDAVRLLPRYDQWVLGPGTADGHVVPAAVRPAVSRGADLLVVGGVVAGTWTLRGDAVVTSPSPGAPRPGRPALEAEVARLGTLLGREVHAADT